MKRKFYAAFALVAAGLFTLGLQNALVAQTPAKIKVAYTATSDFASGFIAAEAGHFKNRGLDVEFQLIPLNSTMPAALAKAPNTSNNVRAARSVRSDKRPSPLRKRLWLTRSSGEPTMTPMLS